MLNFTSNSNIVCYNDIILHYLNTDYINRTNFLYNLSIHIEKLYDNFVLTHDDRRKIILEVNDLVNFINRFYNNSLNLIDGPAVKKLERKVSKIFGKKYGLTKTFSPR